MLSDLLVEVPVLEAFYWEGEWRSFIVEEGDKVVLLIPEFLN